ncbi:MAG TPA: cyclase family protein [Candidatus Limnocylindrales bacterium]|nr:cyclase family protein [Candidatus Limnocylindrales bacterium]
MSKPKLVDLTHPIKPNHWRWPVEFKRIRNYEEGFPFLIHRITLSGHSFTHVDAPSHFIPGGKSFSQLPLDQWFGEAVIVDLTHCQANDPIRVEDLESRGQHIRQGDIVLLRTDWPLKRSIETREFWTEAPYTTREACRWLVQKRVKTVGYDYPPDYSIRYMITEPDRPISREECTTHDVFFKEGICVIEYLTNLHLLKKDRVFLYVFPLLLEGGDGSPVRAVAAEPID